jgi:hypothetical protein
MVEGTARMLALKLRAEITLNPIQNRGVEVMFVRQDRVPPNSWLGYTLQNVKAFYVSVERIFDAARRPY